MELMTMDSRLRDSVTIPMKKATTPWVRLGLMNKNSDPISAADQLSIESFHVSMLDDPNATLFVIASNSGTVAAPRWH